MWPFMAGNSIVIQLFANTKWSPSMKKSSISKKKNKDNGPI